MKDVFVWRPVVDNEFGIENLPLQSDNYLVSTIYGENGNLKTNSYTCYYDAGSKTWETIEGDCVVAWAPIPKPYNGIINLANIKF